MIETEHIAIGKCVYILKTGKNLYKIGKTQHLQKRLLSYHTHLPILFRVIRQFPALNMNELEESLHLLFQHKRVKGEWFKLTPDDLTICDNVARNYALEKLKKQQKQYPEPVYSGDPLLQAMEANEKYLRSYSKIVDDLELGLSTTDIIELHEGKISKVTIDTVRKILKYRTPNAEFLSQWIYIINDLNAGLTEKQITDKYAGEVGRGTIQMIKRILKHQLY
jgi:hypothetical protein